MNSMQNTLTTSAVTVDGETVAVIKKLHQLKTQRWLKKTKKQYQLMLQYLGEDRVPEERLNS